MIKSRPALFCQVELMTGVQMKALLLVTPPLSSIFLLSFSIQQQQRSQHLQGLAWVTNLEA